MNFRDKKIKKSNFYKNKKLFKIDNIDVNKIFLSKKESYGAKKSFKYFVGYEDDDVIRPLYMKLPQTTGYVKRFDSTEIMSFKISDKELLKKYSKIWGKVCGIMNIKYDSEPVYGNSDKYIKT